MASTDRLICLYRPKLMAICTNAFHDRFLILDREIAYHIGASLKDAGKKAFEVTLINDKKITEDILQRLILEPE